MSIIWYLVIRDVDVETFPDRHNQTVLKFKDKYLQAERNKTLKLGNNKQLATFLIIDNREHPDEIQLESVEYPGYLVAYRDGKWILQSQYNIKNSPKSIFIPMGIKKKKNNFCMVNMYNKTCFTFQKNKILARKYKSYPKKNQLIVCSQNN